ncbi:MAG: ATP-binding protein, partial [Bacteroidota bacterium]
VDKVLTFNEFEQKEPSLKIENVNLKTLFEQVSSSLQIQIEQQGATLQMKSIGSDFQLAGDRLHLTNVLYNLLDNALKYSPAPAHIEAYLKAFDDQLEISIRDHGMGIPAAYQERIFDKFFRVPSNDRHNVKGHGLGLSYVASVIKKHKGHISVKSTEGKGTQFIIQLPRKYAQD